MKVGRDGQEMTLSAGISLLNKFISPTEIERSIPSLRGHFTSLTRWTHKRDTGQEKKKTTKQYSHHQHYNYSQGQPSNFYVPSQPQQMTQINHRNDFSPQQFYQRKQTGFTPGRGNIRRSRGSFRRHNSDSGRFCQSQNSMTPPSQRPPRPPPPAAFIPIQGPHRRGKVLIHPVPFIAPAPNMYTSFYPFGQPENSFPEYYNLYRSFVVPQAPQPPQPPQMSPRGKQN